MLHSLPRVLIKFTSNALPNIHDLTPLNYSFNFTENVSFLKNVQQKRMNKRSRIMISKYTEQAKMFLKMREK